MSHGNGAFGETNSASGSRRPQYCCQPDQIVAVGAEPVQQDDELARLAAGGRRARRAGKRHQHRGVFLFTCAEGYPIREPRCHAVLAIRYAEPVWTAKDIQITFDDEGTGGSVLTVRISTPAGSLLVMADLEEFGGELGALAVSIYRPKTRGCGQMRWVGRGCVR